MSLSGSGASACVAGAGAGSGAELPDRDRTASASPVLSSALSLTLAPDADSGHKSPAVPEHAPSRVAPLQAGVVGPGVGPGLPGLPLSGLHPSGIAPSGVASIVSGISSLSAVYIDEVTARSDMEESSTNKTKVSDSAYSTSCNSRSQRSSGSSKSRHSASSNSSGYGGHTSTLSSVTEFTQPTATKRCKDKKKKGSRCATVLPAPPTDCLVENEDKQRTSSESPDTKPIDDASDNTGNSAGLGLGPELVFGGCTSPHDNDALQMAAINQTLSFIQKLKSSNEEPEIVTPDVVKEKNESDCVPCVQSPPIEKSARTKEEFTAIISMSDGIVKHTSAGVTDVLGFPRDMWIGRSITDFVQPKDRAAFASHITSGVASPLMQLDKDCGRRTPFFCSLRCYRGLLRSGFGVKDKAVQYRPCQLTLTFREHLNGIPVPEKNVREHNSTTGTAGGSTSSIGREPPHIFLDITITPISSAYTYPEETRSLPKFATRLLPSTLLSEVDPECVPYLGFLPQDILGRSVLDFYHPEDMPFMKDVYEAVIKEQGVPFLSKPYRFRTQNGGYAVLETEWSSFSNPWSRKLEFIIAQHRVLKGPANPDVFLTPPEGDTLAHMSEEVLKESKMIQEEIQSMLNEAVSSLTENTKKRILSKRCKVLAYFMDSMLEERKKPELHLEVPPEEQSFSERDSVMLGEISPHHEYCDSKSSSETPPSYNQLNYDDNIQRFFESKPKTTHSDESGKEKDGSPGKTSPEQDSSLGSGDSGSGGGSGSHDSATSSSCNSYQQPLLTEALLTRHNENMEKRLVQRHREQRKRSKGDKRDKYQRVPQPGPHGVKRIGSHSWEHHSFKGSKHLHVEANGDVGPPVTVGPAVTVGPPVSTAPLVTAVPTVAMPPLRGDSAAARGSGTGPVSGPDGAVWRTGVAGGAGGTVIVRPPAAGNTAPNIPPLCRSSASNVWPPFSVTVTPLPPSQPAGTYSSFPLVGATPHMMSMYYMPGRPLGGLGAQENQGQPRLPIRNPYLATAAYLPAAPNPHLQLLYQPVPQSLLYSPLSMLHPTPTMLPTSLFPPGACVHEPSQPTQTQSQAQAQIQAQGSGLANQAGQQQQQLSQQSQQHQPQQQELQQQQPQQQQQQPQQLQTLQQQQQLGSAIEESGSCRVQYKFQRPPSQATSVKAEPGSAIGSVASASRQALSVSSNKNKSMSPCGDLSPDEDKAMEDGNQCSQRLGACGDGGSYYSSLYSYLCTDNSDESMPSCKEQHHEKGCSCCSRQESMSSDSNTTLPPRTRPIRSGPPPWMEGLTMTPEVVLHYQLGRCDLADVLSADMSALAKIQQPALVNEQLSQLYEDLALDGSPTTLTLEEGITSSGGSSNEEWAAPQGTRKMKKKRRSVEYAMIFEENAPLPSPVTECTTVA